MGDYSEFVFTSNNGTVCLLTSVSKWSIMTSSTLYVGLTPSYEPPVISTIKEKHMILPNHSSVVYTIVQDSPKLELRKPLFCKGSNYNHTSYQHQPFQYIFSYYPYTQYTHNVKLVQLSNSQSFEIQLSYVGPEIAS
ncbi:hypothetical protein CYY_005124 [Polysphondylium violaceum]|uniref:Uncharacterized protein n=1 Tax=Polysphondylium violaceum TaxID=133409 RepID=A0A8J4UYT7_9MYCE|nr:hypothetical protein CYY_005124 [Polysphondylium violaceum]